MNRKRKEILDVKNDVYLLDRLAIHLVKNKTFQVKRVLNTGYIHKQISIENEMNTFMEERKKNKFYHLGRELSNNGYNCFSGDITSPWIIGAILKYLQVHVKGIIDIGCSAGRILYATKFFFPYTKRVGIEINENIINIAKQIDPNTIIIQGDAQFTYFQENIVLKDINVVYSFNHANLALDIPIYLSILQQSTEFLIITSFFKSLQLYDENIYKHIYNILGDHKYCYHAKLSGEASIYKLKVYKINDDIRERLRNTIQVKYTTDTNLNGKGIYFCLELI